ncbi:MAG: acetyl-CoA C-acyltransferase FadI [Acidimicrobiia bacterium]|nr:acetyl-CoA C-acyltransferase FadI [Acidimicrobiia bacterium]
MADPQGYQNGRRVAIVDGLRTPFMKSGTTYEHLTPIDLGTAAVNELVQRSAVDPEAIDLVVYGAVVPVVAAPNIAREVSTGANLPRSVDAYSVSRACATSTQATINAVQSILSGDSEVAIAGGADSLSRPPITYSDNATAALMRAAKARDVSGKLKAFSQVRPKDLAPSAPALEDMSSGLTMGDAAEKMARENGISREAQDAYAYESHMKAHEAWEKGVFDSEVMHFAVPPSYETTAERDNLTRGDSTLEALAKLRPAFDKRYGTVTAGNSSPLTDGASAVLLMEEKTAERLGFIPRAFIKSWGFAALDPSWQMLMGPSFATPIALDRAGMTLDEIDVVDMHEAFAAQMLSNLQAFASPEWAQKHLGRDRAIGEIPSDKLNLYGGSISLGHPFAATGTRQLTTMANELVRRDTGTALITQCAAGGLGAAVILER